MIGRHWGLRMGRSTGKLADLQQAFEILDSKTDIDSQTYSLEVSRFK